MEAIGPSLTNLKIANNGISDPEPVCYLQRLSSLDMSDNAVEEVASLQFLHCCPYLQQLSITGNPVVKLPKTRESIIVSTDHLEVLDEKDVTQKERMFLRQVQSRRRGGSALAKTRAT